jgi:hypothetical protein
LLNYLVYKTYKEFIQMSYSSCERLIKSFWDYLSGWSWEEWEAAGSAEKEEIVTNALADLGPGADFDIEEAYDLFYEWAEGLTKDGFEYALSESTSGVLTEWVDKSGQRVTISRSQQSPQTKQGPTTWRVSYYEGGVKKSFTVQAETRQQAEYRAWSQVDADSLWVTEVD